MSIKDKYLKQNPEGQVRLKIYLHHPGQFMRHKESPVVESLIVGNDFSRKITLTIPGITTLRKRSTEADHCESNPTNDVITFRENPYTCSGKL